VSEQRYRAVLEVLAEGRTVGEVAAQWAVSRQTLHAWLARYEAEGLEGLASRSHRPVGCPHQMPAAVEAAVLEMRRERPYWGPRRIVIELARKKVAPLPSESGVYRALVRAGVIDPALRRRRDQTWKRWERGRPMELWQMDVVGGFALADGSTAKALTGVDDHSRFCVSARLMPRERTRRCVTGSRRRCGSMGSPSRSSPTTGRCSPAGSLIRRWRCSSTGSVGRTGVEHLLTAPRSPTTTGKIERFHRTLRAEFDTARVFPTLAAAQAALEEWVAYYNSERPHQGIADATPATRFTRREPQDRSAVVIPAQRSERAGEVWVSRKVTSNGVVCVGWQQVSVGKNRGGSRADVLVTDQLLQFWVEGELLKTVTRSDDRPIRKKHAAGSVPRP